MFTAKERRIFRYELPDGRKIARDPARLIRRLEAFRPSNWKTLTAEFGPLDNHKSDGVGGKTLKSSEEYYIHASPAMDTVIPYLCKAYELRILDENGDGLTEEEVIEFHNTFQKYIEKKSEDSEDGANFLPSTQAPTPSPDVSQTTKSSSDCGCGST